LHSRSAPVPAGVTVAVPGRLHLGFLDPAGAGERRFGSIGLAISELETRITIRRATQRRIEGPQSERAQHHLDVMEAHLGLGATHHLRVEAVVPAHSGLGSGTQIALAIAAGLRRLHNRPLDVDGDASLLGRGARSGLGIASFRHGGLIVDGGRGRATLSPPVVSNLHFPETWRVLLVLDPSRQGVHGPRESAAFAALPPFPLVRTSENCRLVLMQALPAIIERDIASFGQAIADLQASLGDYFAPLQGGRRFTSPDVAAALDGLARDGAFGIGQSSWGPTGFAFTPSAEAATRLIENARRDARFPGLDIRICRGLNHGAEITVDATVDSEGT